MSAPAFDHSLVDESRSFELYVMVLVVTVLLILTTSLRVSSKPKKLSLTWDGHLILIGTACNLVGNAFDYKKTASGFGRHEQFLTIEQRIAGAKYAQLAICMAALAICSVKSSICFFLLNIIKGTHRRFTIAIWILFIFTVVMTFVSLMLWGLQARPLPALWDPRIDGVRESRERFVAVCYLTYGER